MLLARFSLLNYTFAVAVRSPLALVALIAGHKEPLH